MKLEVFGDYSGMSRAAADKVVQYLSKKPDALISVASGHTSLRMFEYLVADIQERKVDFSGCMFIGLDEWLGISSQQEGSCRYMMDQYFFNPAGISKSQILFFDGATSDPEGEVARINSWLDKNGPLDIMLVGVGTNGHIAMNEPGTSFQAVAQVSTLAEETISTGQKYFPQQTKLTRGLTLGLRHFQEARLPILTANGNRKASILKQALTGPCNEMVPASVVQIIKHGFILLDKEAAGDLG